MRVKGIALLGLIIPVLGGTARAQLRPTAPARIPTPSPWSTYVPFSYDEWTERITWRTNLGWETTAIHGTLLPNGQLFFIGNPKPNNAARRAAFVMAPDPPDQPMPLEVTVSLIDQPLDATDAVVGSEIHLDDLFCTGHALTSDGDFFTAGGNRLVRNLTGEPIGALGLTYCTLYDYVTKDWIRIPDDMIATANTGEAARWYAAVTRLPDERMMVSTGYDSVAPPLVNLSVEAYDLSTGTWEVLSAFGSTPAELYNDDYTHPFVLPSPIGNLDILMFGAAGVPCFMSTSAGPGWTLSTNSRPGTERGEAPNDGASSSLLPIRVTNGEWGYNNGSVLIAGGEHDTSHHHHADVYDPISDRWFARIDLLSGRHHPTCVVLPDARIAVIGGHEGLEDPNGLRTAYVDPREGFETKLGSGLGVEIRGYHNVALLLPDGRILSGGGQGVIQEGSLAEKTNYRYVSPSYMFETRPQITLAPTSLGYAQNFNVTTTGATPAEFVLMSLGSITHSFDFNQRYVQLDLVQTVSVAGSHDSSLTAPPNSSVAPPGHYMLFVLDEDRIPSVAAFVKLQ